jgi:hypothetical protein
MRILITHIIQTDNEQGAIHPPLKTHRNNAQNAQKSSTTPTDFQSHLTSLFWGHFYAVFTPFLVAPFRGFL